MKRAFFLNPKLYKRKKIVFKLLPRAHHSWFDPAAAASIYQQASMVRASAMRIALATAQRTHFFFFLSCDNNKNFGDELYRTFYGVSNEKKRARRRGGTGGETRKSGSVSFNWAVSRGARRCGCVLRTAQMRALTSYFYFLYFLFFRGLKSEEEPPNICLLPSRGATAARRV